MRFLTIVFSCMHNSRSDKSKFGEAAIVSNRHHTNVNRKHCNYIFVIVFILCLISTAFASAKMIEKIDIEGVERVSRDTVLAYLDIKTPTEYNQGIVDSGIHKLFTTGFFSDVKISIHDKTLIVSLEESPLIYRVAFEGNNKIKDDVLKKELILLPQTVYSLQKLQADIKKITMLYQKQGRYSVKIEPRMIKLSQNRIDLIYIIKEGPKAKIRQIDFAGNKEFTEDQLKASIMSQEYAWYRILATFPEDYDPDHLLLDQELLRQLYMNSGFLDFEVLSVASELSLDKDSVILTFTINEGEKYRINNVEVVSNIKGFEKSDLANLITIKKGEIFKLEAINHDIDKITAYLNNHGYAFADVSFEPEKSDKNSSRVTNIKIIIKEGSKIYINKINISNNIMTRDNVIRREFKLGEGDPYNENLLLRSKQRVTNLGYFSLVEFHKNKTLNPDQVDINVNAKEVPTGSLNFGVAYNSQSGIMGTIDVVERNFLGKGQIAQMNFARGVKSTDVSFAFTEPYFLGKSLAAGFDVFMSNMDKSKDIAYKLDTYGGALRMGYSINEYLIHSLAYGIKRRYAEIPDKTKASLIVREIEGNSTTSYIAQAFSYNKLNNNIIPTSGYSLKLSQELAGVGGDTRHLKNQVFANYYLPVYKHDVIFTLSGQAGNISGLGKQTVRLVDNFYIGEQYVRGFSASGIGPRDIKRDANGNPVKNFRGDYIYTDALGGRNYYAATAELTFPIGLPEELGVRGAVFFDIGSLWNIDSRCKNDSDLDVCKTQYDQIRALTDSSAMRSSYGIGVIWRSPLGNIRLDYGIPVGIKPFDQQQNFRLTLGSAM